MNTYKVARKGVSDWTEVTADRVMFERTHVVFVDSVGDLIQAFNAETVLRVIRNPIG